MSSGSEVLTFVLAVATFSCGYCAANAVWPSFYGEMFDVRVRFSGMAIGTQLGFLLGGFRPEHRHGLGGVREGGWVVISVFTAAVAVVASLSALTAGRRGRCRRPSSGRRTHHAAPGQVGV